MEFPTTTTAAHQQKLAVNPSIRAATKIDELHSDVITAILLRLNGPALASVARVDSGLHKLASDRALWERLCFSSFPSLALRPELLDSGTGSPRRFFSHAYPFPAYQDATPRPPLPPPPGYLVSAVDVYHCGNLVYSTLVDTETQSSWFLSAPLCIDALERTDVGKDYNHNHAACTLSNRNTTPISPEELTLTWVLIDPSTGDAINLSSHQPVAVEQQRYTGQTQIQFATVLSTGGVGVATITVKLGGSGLPGDGSILSKIQEVSLSVEDGVDGASMTGKEGLDMLRWAITGSRNRVVGGDLEVDKRRAVQRYREFQRNKKELKERKAVREARVDLCYTVMWASLLLSTIAVAFG